MIIIFYKIVTRTRADTVNTDGSLNRPNGQRPGAIKCLGPPFRRHVTTTKRCKITSKRGKTITETQNDQKRHNITTRDTQLHRKTTKRHKTK